MPKYLIEKCRDGLRIERAYRSRSDAAANLAWKYAYDALSALALRDRPIAHDALRVINSFDGKETKRVEIGGIYRVAIVRLS